MKNLKIGLFLVSISCITLGLKCLYAPRAEQRTLRVWHAMDYDLGKTFDELIVRYNALPEVQASGVTISGIYKGSYDKTLQATLAAAGTDEQPHIAQIFEMGTLQLLQEQQKRSIIIPVEGFAGIKPDQFIPSVSQFYQARTGSLNSVPFNASTVVLYFNKTLLSRAGVATSDMPKTWEELVLLIQELKKKGFSSGLAHGWLTGHGIDQLAARHNVALAEHGNGIDAPSLRMNHTGNGLLMQHIATLKELYEQNLFTLKVGADAEAAFAAEEVVFLTQGANRVSLLENRIKDMFELGACEFPYWQQFATAPSNTIAGGASFWVLAGHKKADYVAIKHFLNYLISVPTQHYWHTKTGYIPVVPGVIEQCQAEGFYEKNLFGRVALLGITSLLAKQPETFSRGILLPNFPAIREAQIAWMTQAITGHVSVEQALQEMDLAAVPLLNK